MVDVTKSKTKITLAEKVFVNYFLLPEAVIFAVRSKITHDQYYSQTFMERITAMGTSRVERYHKLLEIKKEYGYIPSRVRQKCIKDPCGLMRLFLAYVR